MDRLDSYEVKPAGMDNYLSSYGYHFSKAMCEWAVTMMKDRNGSKLQMQDKEKVDSVLNANGITLDNDRGYDKVFVFNMGRSDYMGSSISDEAHLAKYVKDVLDDKDGYEGIAFTRFYADCIGKGIPIVWEDMM